MQLAILKKCSGRTEDKISSTFYIAVGKQQTATLRACINGILISKKAAADKHQPVSFGMEGNCLPQRSGIILNRQVLESDITAFHFHGVGTECSHLIDIGMIIIRNNRLFGIFTYQLHVLHPRRNH